MKTFYIPVEQDSEIPVKGTTNEEGVHLISFECKDVPEGATFLFACDSPNLRKDEKDVIHRKIYNSSLLSEYAYFKI